MVLNRRKGTSIKIRQNNDKQKKKCQKQVGLNIEFQSKTNLNKKTKRENTNRFVATAAVVYTDKLVYLKLDRL